MKEYVFYTTEGYTAPPNENMSVENCQLLGFSKGVTKGKALEALIIDNPWIVECGFNTDCIQGVQVVRE